MKHLVSIILCLVILMSLEKGWAQDIDNVEPTELSDSNTESIINSVSEFGVSIKNMFISPPDPIMDLKKQNLDLIRSVEKYVLDIIDLREKEIISPDSSWFGDTKESVREDLDEILE